MEDATKIIEFFRVGSLLTAAVVLFATWAISRLLSRFFDGLGRRFTDRRLQINQVSSFTRFLLFVAGISAAFLLSVNLSKEMVLALGGTVAVTLGFALKDLAASVIAGITILIDKPFQVGDRVAFGGVYGEITSLGLRSVQLVTLDDNVVTIPNNKFLTDLVSSGNYGALDMLVQIDLFVGVDQDLAIPKRILGEAVVSSTYAYLEKPWNVSVSEVIDEGYLAVRLRAKVYVLDVVYEKALETDVTERALEGFRLAGVKPPTSHRSCAA
ncbi:MAG: mechanosensitive ion channel [Myxococcota bacterium]|nr:mechanosensitive ion channel [Myxococcota bacterium]